MRKKYNKTIIQLAMRVETCDAQIGQAFSDREQRLVMKKMKKK